MRLALTHGSLAVAPLLERHSDLRVCPCYEEFSFGPLPTGVRLAEFLSRRQAYWGPMMPPTDVAVFWSDLRAAISADRAVEVWTSDTVQETCHALGTLHLLQLEGIAARVAIRDFGACGGLALLPGDRLAALYETSAVGPADPGLCAGAFAALAQGSGEAIRDWLDQHPDTPFAPAFSALLLRYPAFNGGLGALDRALLAGAPAEMRSSAYTIGNAMALGLERIDHVGDGILYRRLLELASQDGSWFELEGDAREMRRLRARISPEGEAARLRFGVQSFSG